MRRRLSVLTATRTSNVQQASVLILLGIVFLALAWLLNLNPYAVPVGVFLFGVGMLASSLLNPSRLGSAGWLTTFFGSRNVSHLQAPYSRQSDTRLPSSRCRARTARYRVYGS